MIEARSAAPSGTILASGGLKNGVDAAKVIALGADLAGFGRSLLPDAWRITGVGRLIYRLRQVMEMKIAMFGAGIGSVKELSRTDRLVFHAWQ